MAEHVVLVVATTTGGTGAHVRSLARRLAGRGVEVTVCGPRSAEDSFGFVAAGARFAPVEIASGPRPYADARAALALREQVGRGGVVHAHGLRAGLIAAGVTPRRTPYVVTWHNAAISRGLLRPAAAGAERIVALRADVSLCVSPDLEARVRSLGGRDVRPGPVAGPPLPAAGRPAAEVRAELGAADRSLVLSVGRLHPQKGYRTLVAAAACLATRRPAPLFVVAGDGPQRAELAAEITRCAAPVRLLGWRTDLADLFAAADVVVSTSLWEGSPLAVQEALRAGRPLVATAVGGVPALVGDGAELVPPEDPAALAAAVARVLDDPDHAVSLVARGRVAAGRLPTEDSTFARVTAVYAELLGHSV
ncbi:MAG: glycosyltransferase [Pseudonocardiales bacterium]|nr:MAG: glycosyltransferase [Pseudonocardiales bacterium]